MNHSHLPVAHFIAQLDKWKEERRQRDLRPDWLNRFIVDVAELFDPFEEVARVGFECRPDEDEGWQVGLFLGRTEIVGGRNDGRAEWGNFTFDVKRLVERFESVEDFRLFAFPKGDARIGSELLPCAFLTLHGLVESQRLTLRVFTIPPQEAGIGLRRFTDGRCETV